ncbi:LuxR C-terminal-related transcriptional regulator [Nocardia sp. NPDC052566]|uniref:LuxR C-terminal-related transcriptional regulator n=1 Tax=Nocardia sp. NPDC052566 TaxID=3364330 RepID=UPI0037C7D10C
MLARIQTNAYPAAAPEDTKSVLLVSDSPFTLEHFEHGLATVDNLTAAGACGWRDVVERAAWWCPDIIVLDALPQDGLPATVRRLRSLSSPPLIVLLVHREVDGQIIDCVDAAFALDLGLEPVLNGLQLLASGVLMTASPRPVAPARAAGTHQRLSTLTDREREVLVLLVDGMSNREVGARLFISPDTVKEHVSRILGKLGVSSRIEAAVLAVRAGMDH